MTAKAHAAGCSLEAEIGHVGSNGSAEEAVAKTIYTQPQDALRFAAESGCDALAVAIGTAHGVYAEKPVLNLCLLYTSRPGAISAWRGSATAATVMSASSERKDFIIVSERRPYPMNPMRFIIPFLHFLCGAAFLYITYKRRANGFAVRLRRFLYACRANNYLIISKF